jgi:hypothetical protein
MFFSLLLLLHPMYSQIKTENHPQCTLCSCSILPLYSCTVYYPCAYHNLGFSEYAVWSFHAPGIFSHYLMCSK